MGVFDFILVVFNLHFLCVHFQYYLKTSFLPLFILLNPSIYPYKGGFWIVCFFGSPLLWW